ncbi:endonuclease/exonuclease/phosphatase family protein [Thiohalomonas denitrificans]|uniref:Metal-dependent hydrolase, endonuclease/exonuclease/phosphatase family n=1 Tax=Thiohalomonas denitrificans TaxID=415747 RepID=A0A1G5Q2C0_9GAMM|nr:endonuclease/exonuclease/phosphatase family protein [Thiohalomonas denitrificans]SCZ55600.1 Metal-dependent hydrolase, endonuclease/exonuclease/phosphatase family [Thiohalomonas denitrificans]
MQLTFASYNIHRCIGRDGRRDPDRIIRVLNEFEADVIALQEVETYPGGDRDFLARLGTRTGMRVIPGPTLRHKHYRYGNAILTRARVNAVRRIDLSLLEREPRGALQVDLEWDETPVEILATHLGLWPLERRFQIQQILELLALEDRSPAALLGDINEWFSWGRPLRWLHGHFGRPPSPATFPSGFPVLALDRIWFRPRECLDTITPHRSPLARVASDHLPLLATVTLPAEASSSVAEGPV